MIVHQKPYKNSWELMYFSSPSKNSFVSPSVSSLRSALLHRQLIFIFMIIVSLSHILHLFNQDNLSRNFAIFSHFIAAHCVLL